MIVTLTKLSGLRTPCERIGATAYGAIQGRKYEPAHSRDLCNGFCRSVRHRHLDRFACVISLLARCSPSAVARLVVAIAVASFNRIAGWAWSHVGNKVLKCQPSFADRDAAAPVNTETFVFGIEATRFHRQPHAVFPRCAVIQRVPVGSASFSQKLALQTAAALRRSLFKWIGTDKVFGSAIAQAAPNDFCVFPLAGIFDNYQSAESATRQIGFHRWILT